MASCLKLCVIPLESTTCTSFSVDSLYFSILGAVSIIVSVVIKRQVKSPKVCKLTLIYSMAKSVGGWARMYPWQRFNCTLYMYILNYTDMNPESTVLYEVVVMFSRVVSILVW